MHHIHTVDKMLKDKHYAALVFSTIYIPGDERSQTNPGHGYPESNKPVVKYIAFESFEEMTNWVTKEESGKYGKSQYKIFEMNPLEVKMETVISIEKAS